MELKERVRYPHSLGILYSAFTKRVGLKPAEEEYILMGMAAYGNPIYKDKIQREFIKKTMPLTLTQNLHRGIGDWEPEADTMDLASSIQSVTEELLANLYSRAKSYLPAKSLMYPEHNLVFGGGVALNCAANSKLANLGLFDNIWIMPNPGDAGSSLGCIAASQKQFLDWQNPFLGYNIQGEYPIDKIIKELEQNKMCGVANGRAEFGPRALGNRSFLADPRGPEVKDLVNKIKRRQKFRPFAPAILEEDVHEFFRLPRHVKNTPYMQFTAACTGLCY
jgi:carbamoyltransferase